MRQLATCDFVSDPQYPSIRVVVSFEREEHWGTVVYYDPRAGYFGVRYDDGDEQELNVDEFLKALRHFPGFKYQMPATHLREIGHGCGRHERICSDERRQ